jgi:hypothetical protein
MIGTPSTVGVDPRNEEALICHTLKDNTQGGGLLPDIAFGSNSDLGARPG